MYNFFTKNCIAPYAEKFDNAFQANVEHCHTFDTIQLFGMAPGYSDQIEFFKKSPKVWYHQINRLSEDDQNELLRIVNNAGPDRYPDKPWEPVENILDEMRNLEKPIVDHIRFTNQTLNDIFNWKNNILNYEEKIMEKYSMKNVTMNSCKACQMWVDDQTKAMVMCSCYRVMLPSLILFTILTVILHFFSMYTDRSSVRRGKRKLNRMKTRFKTKISSRKRVNGINNNIDGNNKTNPGILNNASGMNDSNASPGTIKFSEKIPLVNDAQHTSCVITTSDPTTGPYAGDSVKVRLLEQYRTIKIVKNQNLI